VGQPAGIENNAVVVEAYFVQLIDQSSFVVGLKIVNVYLRELAAQEQIKVLEGVLPVNLRLAPAEEI
jgi:hypothetical protein